MKCNSCGNEHAYRMRIVEGTEICDKCGCGPVAGLPDVSAVPMPYYDEHLKCEVQDRHHKARLLKEKGWYEKRESKHPYISDPIARQKYFKDNIGE